MDICTAMRGLCFTEWNIHRPPNDMGLDLRVTKSRQKLRVKLVMTVRAQCLTAPRQRMAKESRGQLGVQTWCVWLQKEAASTVGKKSDTQPEGEHEEKCGAGYLKPLFLSRFLMCSAQCLYHEHCYSWKCVKQMLGNCNSPVKRPHGRVTWVYSGQVPNRNLGWALSPAPQAPHDKPFHSVNLGLLV